MSPSAHPSDAVLMDYATGALRPAFAVVVAAHVERCAPCRDQLDLLETLGGELVDDLPPTPMSDEALQQAMARIERPSPSRPAPSSAAVERIPFGRERWLGPGMGLRKASVGTAGDLLYLLRLPAGITTIPHGHDGIEFTTVLKGAFKDAGRVFHAGDFAELTDDVEHMPHVTRQGECICLIASEKPMRVRTLLGRLIQMAAGV